MHQRDEVIRHAASAAADGGHAVGRALADYLSDSGAGSGAERALRGELVALAAGYERSAADGATRERRVAAAQAAIVAWDGPQLEQATWEPMAIRAARVVWASVWSVTVYSDGTVGHLPHGFDALLALGVQATGSRGDAAVLWAMAESQRRRESAGSNQSSEALAHALDHVASEMGSESARSLVDRMPERLRDYVRTVWQAGRK